MPRRLPLLDPTFDVDEPLDMNPRAPMGSRRKHAVRARTENVVRMAKTNYHAGREANPEDDYERPTTRGQCVEEGSDFAFRPCPFVSCRYHLAIVAKQDAIKIVFPTLDDENPALFDVDWEHLPESCALDVADRGENTLEVVGDTMNLTRERVRQIEERAYLRMRQLRGEDAKAYRTLRELAEPVRDETRVSFQLGTPRSRY